MELKNLSFVLRKIPLGPIADKSAPLSFTRWKRSCQAKKKKKKKEKIGLVFLRISKPLKL